MIEKWNPIAPGLEDFWGIVSQSGKVIALRVASEKLAQICDEHNDYQKHVLASRVEELDRALRLALSVSEDDPILVTEPEKEIYRLREQLRGLRESVIASAFESHVRLLHGADYEVCDNPFCKFAYALEQQKTA